MREHKDAAVKMRCIGSISAFLAYPWLGIVVSFLISIEPNKDHVNNKSVFPCGVTFSRGDSV